MLNNSDASSFLLYLNPSFGYKYNDKYKKETVNC